MILIHVPSGNIGEFVKEFTNRYQDSFEDSIIIKLDNGSKYFAPRNEFRRVESAFYLVGENNKPEIIVDKFGERQGTFEGHIRLNKNEIDFLKSFKNNKTH